MQTIHKPWDFSTANVLGLVSAIILLIAFIFMPWLGREANTNGARLLSDSLYGAPGSPQVPLLWLVPITAVAGIALALWGVFVPERSRITSIVILLVGLVGLAYYVLSLEQPVSSEAALGPGIGLWIALVCTLGLVLQVVVSHPLVNSWLETGSRLLARFPPISPKAIPYLFLAPALALYLVWIIGPTLYTMYLSLTNWDGVSTPHYIGFQNFLRLFQHDRTFIEALTNNLRWLVVFITVPTTLGLGMALVFNTEMHGGRVYKVSFYAPLVLSLPVIGLIWSWLYNPRLGLVNAFLSGVGVEHPPGWLGDRELAIWCVIATAVWRQVGYVMVLYLAGLKNIDPSLIDAALVDGASRWNLFRHVVLPLLAPVTTIIMVISIIDSLRAFDLVSIMTRGGQSTQVLANFMYMEAFNNYRMGYGAAIAVILFAISAVFIGFYLSRVVKDELEY